MTRRSWNWIRRMGGGHAAVPLTRRNLLADRRRLAAGVLGVGLAVMLILLLDGLWAGIRRQATVYPDRVGADLYVLQPGVRDLAAGTGTVPLTAVRDIAADPDVSWVAPVRTAYLILQLHDKKVAVYAVGSVPGRPGGAWSLAAGRIPSADDEIALGKVVADRHGLRVGDRIDVGGSSLRVVGLSRSTGFMIDYVFVTHAALGGMTAATTSTTAILAGSRDPAAVAGRLGAQGLNARSRSQVALANLDAAAGIFGSPIRLMVAIGFAAGTLIMALTAYTAIVERRREYGIVRALGATRRRLAGLAVAQTFTLTGLGLLAGGALSVAGRAVIGAVRPQFEVAVTTDSLGRAAISAVAMAVLAALVPARRMVAIEPATAFRSAS